ncbi:alginate O-acetyltransferase AlgF [Pusillimonas sp. CC-YST705]|uniref:Alginate biosynthesis protein AlgF n=1 Tax=Mesopusillimonas faecipullorum TaxID=2755040 RepID=A0ABS8CEW6_9BURK|nr:alginate O-acetyltransferase AlgF [Mesopusillimonas faecipullorum]MCB5364543.1 alginate O-acetyltransferase AlgF [Mesopusillimonas faecipullorum]
MKKFLRVCLLALAAMPVAAVAMDIPLYETGPAEDSAFIRFVNATDAPIEVKAAGAKTTLALSPEQPASNFLPAPAKRALKGELVQATVVVPTETTVEAGEFVTVVALPDAKNGLSALTIRETPDDFNALKASVGLYNLSPSCADATIRAAGRKVVLFGNVPAGQAANRLQINPVPLSVQLFCADQETGAPVSLGTLEAGERYTLFLVPTESGARLIPVVDTVSF